MGFTTCNGNALPMTNVQGFHVLLRESVLVPGQILHMQSGMENCVDESI